ncbi:hypothetical protein PG999_005293 [Apiospora kogelbergensis]|uniref:Uncharacterized protein n=1 Tax=Apiospora kogelbergensis TaxID=1337665 RepID=A0AAW0R1T3_9PEZI
MADMTAYQPNQPVVPAAQPQPTTELVAGAEANGPLIPRHQSPSGDDDGDAAPPPGRSCHLLAKLPLELRNAVYAELLPRGPPQYPNSFRRHRMPAEARPRFWTPAVAQACRQLRREVLTLLLGGVNAARDPVLRLGLWAQQPWDALFLERWLRALGADARLVRRLAVQHEVDFFHATAGRLYPVHGVYPDTMFTGTKTVWADTLFVVEDDVSDDDGAQRVRVDCDFATPAHPAADQIPAGSICLCPLAARMLPPAAVALPPGVADCALTRAVYAFLALMDKEGQDEYAVPRFRTGDEWAARAEGLCPRCGRRRWYLQGPKTAACRERKKLGFGGRWGVPFPWCIIMDFCGRRTRRGGRTRFLRGRGWAVMCE